MNEICPYDVTIDHPQRRVRFIIRGFWTAETFNSFRAAAAGTLGQCRGSSTEPRYDLIVDLRDGFVQSPEIVKKLSVLSEKHLAMVRRKAVILPDSALTRSQLGRQELRESECRFRDEESALQWLESAVV